MSAPRRAEGRLSVPGSTHIEKRKLAVVTGATSGIGRAFAERLAAQGHDLIITGRRKREIEAVASAIREARGVEVRVIIAELSDPRQAESLARTVSAEERVEVLVSNAGYGLGEAPRTHSVKEVQEELAMIVVHLHAAVRLAHAVLPQMERRGRGAIIFVSSMAGFTPGVGNGVYGGTKSFLNFFGESLSMEVRRHGISVQCLCPGFTHTDFHSRLGITRKLSSRGLIRWMSPERVVDFSLRSLGSRKVLCVPGTLNRLEIGLLRLLPRRLYYSLAERVSGRGVI